jgi:hypothetical protein
LTWPSRSLCSTAATKGRTDSKDSSSLINREVSASRLTSIRKLAALKRRDLNPNIVSLEQITQLSLLRIEVLTTYTFY